MLWVPQKGIVRVEHNNGEVGTVTPGTSVTTGASASIKGTPAEVFASTTFDAFWVTIMASGYGSTTAASEGALDILIGAATEEVLIANLLFGFASDYADTGNRGPKRWDFPLYIPASSRIAVQAAGRRTSTAFQVSMFLYGGSGSPNFRVGGRVTTYGMGTVPNGTAITPGASGAEGAWAEITASTTVDHFAFVPSFQIGNDGTTTLKTLAVDLGIGAATEEQIMESYWYVTSGSEQMGGPYNSMPVFQDVPSGTRLVMRASNSGTNDAAYDGVIHAVS